MIVLGKMFSIISLNVRGISNYVKSWDVFGWLRENKIDAYLLQDMHCDVDTIHIWEQEWGG